MYSLKNVRNILLITLLFYFIFAVVGVQLFKVSILSFMDPFFIDLKRTTALPNANRTLVASVIITFVFTLRGNFGIVQIFRRWQMKLASKYKTSPLSPPPSYRRWHEPRHFVTWLYFTVKITLTYKQFPLNNTSCLVESQWVSYCCDSRLLLLLKVFTFSYWTHTMSADACQWQWSHSSYDYVTMYNFKIKFKMNLQRLKGKFKKTLMYNKIIRDNVTDATSIYMYWSDAVHTRSYY